MRCGDERARFAREAQRLERLFDGGGEFGEICGGFDAAPDDARLEFVGEKTERAKMHLDGLRGTNRRERGADGVELFGSNIRR